MIYTNKMFDESFIGTFTSMMNTIDTSLDALNKTTNATYTGYGLCNKTYSCRLITPANVVSFIDNIMNISVNNSRSRICNNMNDYEMIMVALVKRFISDNECTAFCDTGNGFINNQYLSSKNCTLRDLILSWENDGTVEKSVYSAYEMKERANSKHFSFDLKKLNDIHFVATMKNIVNKLPDIVFKCVGDKVDELIVECINEFVLFTCTMFMMTISDMLSYTSPSSTYDINKEKNYMECCLLKTNTININNKLPFDCNMRNMVIGDTSRGFSDTENALKFVIMDARSPISVLLNRYRDKNCMTDHTGIASKIFNAFPSEKKEFISLDFTSDANWIDKIACGDEYMNGNYRTDAVGNNHAHSIVNTLNMIYRMYDCENISTNVDLSNHICSLYSIMTDIISYNNCGSCNTINVDMVRDVLAVFGEIFTRSVLKLYANNTKIIDCSDSMEDAMVPGYLYAESFVMEDGEAAGTTAQKTAIDTPSVSAGQANGKQQTVTNSTNVSKIGNIKRKISDIVTKFMNWLRTQFVTFGSRFNKDHALELKWITKNDALNKEIGAALANKTFTANLNAFPDFNIPANELGNIKIDEVINKWLSSKDPIDAKLVKKDLYPGGDTIATQIANAKTPEEETAMLTNYILYKNIKPNKPYTGPMTQKQWDDLVGDLTSTGRLIESQTRKTSDALRKACENLQTKIRKGEVSAATNTDKTDGENTSPDAATSDRAAQLFTIIQGVSASYFVMMLNTFRSKFYAINYKMYRDIVKIYNQSKTNANKQQPQQQTNPNGNINNNPDNAEMPPQN